MNPRPSVLETDALPTELYPSEAGAGLAAKDAARKTVVGRPLCCSDTRPLPGGLRGISVLSARGSARAFKGDSQ